MKILGFDPGVSKVGWSIIEDGKLIDYGFQKFSSTEEKFNDKVNQEIKAALDFLKDKVDQVDAVAWEIVPAFGKMGQRDRIVGVATTLKILTFQKKKKWFGRPPIVVKKLFTGDGKASKIDMRNKAESVYPQLLELKKKMSPDVYDSIAIGYVAYVQNEWND